MEPRSNRLSSYGGQMTMFELDLEGGVNCWRGAQQTKQGHGPELSELVDRGRFVWFVIEV